MDCAAQTRGMAFEPGEGVIRCVKGLPGWEVLAVLPDRFTGPGTAARRAPSAKSAAPATSLPEDWKRGPVRGLRAPRRRRGNLSRLSSRQRHLVAHPPAGGMASHAIARQGLDPACWFWRRRWRVCRRLLEHTLVAGVLTRAMSWRQLDFDGEPFGHSNRTRRSSRRKLSLEARNYIRNASLTISAG
jgi:hypothetical protein